MYHLLCDSIFDIFFILPFIQFRHMMEEDLCFTVWRYGSAFFRVDF